MKTSSPDAVDVYLASASPRRRELLSQTGLRFRVLKVNVEESCRAGESPRACARRLAVAKARAAAALIELRGLAPRPVIAADTLVVVGARVLGKPGSRAEGLRMLAALSGRTHEVWTALAVYHKGQMRTAMSQSLVGFEKLTAAEMRRYWDSGEPADKAGSYAIQGLAAAFVRRLEGSYHGVVGLPLRELRALMRKTGVDWL
jgi:septum formation protein